jgi:hypothetical protein
LDNLDDVRHKFQTIIDRFAGFQAQWLNVHVDLPLLQRIALPITVGSIRYPGIKIHNTRVVRLREVVGCALTSRSKATSLLPRFALWSASNSKGYASLRHAPLMLLSESRNVLGNE